MPDYKVPIITGTSLAVGDLLRWDGNNWVNYPDSNYDCSGGPVSLVDSNTDIFIKSHAYLAQTSGYVTVFTVDVTDSNLLAWVGDTNDPFNDGVRVAQTSSPGARPFIAFFVPEGAYYEIRITAGVITATWTPLIAGKGNPVDQD